MAGWLNSNAQIEVVPVKRSFSPPFILPSARQPVTEPLALPFWDDFSTPSGMFPDSSLWEHSNSIWVNNTMALEQPTVNVATFDGLDSTGLAYDPNNILVTGYTDKLISRSIDLSDPLIDKSSLYLSFFYQWQGNGEAPDLSDYLELQFKDNAGTWITKLSIYPKTTFERRIFYDTAIRVDSNYFFHGDFQFRFRSFGRQSGPFDTWNLDYIYLNDGRVANDDSFPERAAASAISSPFGSYTSMPYWHFTPENFQDTVVTFAVKNLSDLLDPVTEERYFIAINYVMLGRFTNYLSDGNVSVVEDTLVRSKGVNDINGQMEPYERLVVESSNLFENSGVNNYFDAEADSVDLQIKAVVLSDDEGDRDKDKLAPIDLTINDTVSTVYRLRDYYAYDDGIAEYSAGLIQPGSRIAYEFEEAYDNGATPINEPDTLLGFDVYFPAYGITSNQTINFYIFDIKNGKPGDIIQTVFRGIERLDMNEFQEIRFSPALLIDGKFFIGWEQPVAGKALVGLDIDNDTGDKMFVTIDKTNWSQNDVVKGSLMVRPVFGSGSVENIIPGVGEDHTFKVYPNPAKGIFYINGRYDNLKIFSLTGAMQNFEAESDGEETRIKVLDASGLFLVKLVRNNKVETHKILLTR
jgi:hypothetical protein